MAKLIIVAHITAKADKIDLVKAELEPKTLSFVSLRAVGKSMVRKNYCVTGRFT